ncbi:DNA polymerase III subunit delta' [Membranihabitans marinus]
MQRDRAPHAILFSGQEGRGVFMEAFYYTLTLMCQNPQPEPCMTCNNCKRTVQWIHPDIHVTFPTFGRDQTSKHLLTQWRSFIQERDYITFQQWAQFIKTTSKPNIYMKEFQDIVQTYHLKTYEGGKKIFFIWGAEYLGKEGNKLLKSIEEPTDNTYFIFITYNKSAILPTILSRLQHIDVPKANDESIIQYCMDRNLGTEHQIKEAVYLADGNIADALDMIEQQNFQFSEYLLSGLRMAIKNNGPGMMAWADQVQKLNNSEFLFFLKYQLHFLRETMASNYRDKYVKKLLRDEQKASNYLLTKLTAMDFIPMVQKMNTYIESMRQNANKKILAANLILDYKDLIRK